MSVALAMRALVDVALAPWVDEVIPQGREVSQKQSVFSVVANQ
ncbi:hypothetical protein [Bradyrhizobium sp. 44]|nr:hypothetical protein [Bradyrhizobium sp. 44]